MSVRRLRPVDEPFDLELSPTDAVRFIPMDLSESYRTIRQSHSRDTLAFDPFARTEVIAKPSPRPQAGTAGDPFDSRNRTDDLECHALVSRGGFPPSARAPYGTAG